MVGLGVVEPGNIRAAVALDLQLQGLDAQAGHAAVSAFAVRQQGVCVQPVDQGVYSVLHRRLREPGRPVLIRRTRIKGDGRQIPQPGNHCLAAVQQMVADQGDGVGGELGGGAVVGGGGPAEGQAALLTQILIVQAAHSFIGMDVPGNDFVHQGQILLCQPPLLRGEDKIVFHGFAFFRL